MKHRATRKTQNISKLKLQTDWTQYCWFIVKLFEIIEGICFCTTCFFWAGWTDDQIRDICVWRRRVVNTCGWLRVYTTVESREADLSHDRVLYCWSTSVGTAAYGSMFMPWWSCCDVALLEHASSVLPHCLTRADQCVYTVSTMK